MPVNAIWKFTLPLIPEKFEKKFPLHSEILHLALQGEIACLWVRVNPDQNEMETRRFVWLATGQADDAMYFQQYIGTIQTEEGFVFHLYEMLI
jgi:hypothetical protein